MSHLYALGDLHLAGDANKTMDLFGEQWISHPEKIASHWKNLIKTEDIVLIPGDISWAMKWEGAQKDLTWINALPGKKILIRGNHDYWWPSKAKWQEKALSSLYPLYLDPLLMDNYLIGGTRFWDSPETKKNIPRKSPEEPLWSDLDEKVFKKELTRAQAILEKMQKEDPLHKKKWVFMLHYPPKMAPEESTAISSLLESFFVDCVVFGHLHGISFFPSINSGKTEYHLTSADFINFIPKKIY